MTFGNLFVNGLVVVHNLAINNVSHVFVDESTASTKDISFTRFLHNGLVTVAVVFERDGGG